MDNKERFNGLTYEQIIDTAHEYSMIADLKYTGLQSTYDSWINGFFFGFKVCSELRKDDYGKDKEEK